MRLINSYVSKAEFENRTGFKLTNDRIKQFVDNWENIRIAGDTGIIYHCTGGLPEGFKPTDCLYNKTDKLINIFEQWKEG